MPMQSCFITGYYYVRNAVKHMYPNWLMKHLCITIKRIRLFETSNF